MDFITECRFSPLFVFDDQHPVVIFNMAQEHVKPTLVILLCHKSAESLPSFLLHRQDQAPHSHGLSVAVSRIFFDVLYLGFYDSRIILFCHIFPCDTWKQTPRQHLAPRDIFWKLYFWIRQLKLDYCVLKFFLAVNSRWAKCRATQ